MFFNRLMLCKPDEQTFHGKPKIRVGCEPILDLLNGAHFGQQNWHSAFRCCNFNFARHISIDGFAGIILGDDQISETNFDDLQRVWNNLPFAG